MNSTKFAFANFGVGVGASTTRFIQNDKKNVILTELLEICIIELPKINKIQQEDANEIRAWLSFLENPEKMEMEGMSKENKEAIKEAKDVLKEISSDERERYLADLRLKYIMDQKAIEEYGYDHGLEEGKKLRNRTRKTENSKRNVKATIYYGANNISYRINKRKN